MKYINLFATQAAYDAAQKYYPNVSYVVATDQVIYQETLPNVMVGTFTTTSANQSVVIAYKQELFSSIKVNGVEQTITTGQLSYTFATAGEHEVVYELVNELSVGFMAFYECTNLTSITIPNTVTEIGTYVFYRCGLTSVEIPSAVTWIGDYAFWFCTDMTSITCLATTPPTIGLSTFNSVPATCPIYVPAESVNAYKAATYWSDRAAYIQAIP